MDGFACYPLSATVETTSVLNRVETEAASHPAITISKYHGCTLGYSAWDLHLANNNNAMTTLVKHSTHILCYTNLGV